MQLRCSNSDSRSDRKDEQKQLTNTIDLSAQAEALVEKLSGKNGLQPKFSRILFGGYNFIKIRRITADAEFFSADLRRRTKIWRIRRMAAA